MIKIMGPYITSKLPPEKIGMVGKLGLCFGAIKGMFKAPDPPPPRNDDEVIDKRRELFRLNLYRNRTRCKGCCGSSILFKLRKKMMNGRIKLYHEIQRTINRGKHGQKLDNIQQIYDVFPGKPPDLLGKLITWILAIVAKYLKIQSAQTLDIYANI